MKAQVFLGMAVLALSIVSCSGEEEKTVEQTIEMKDIDGEKEVNITTTEDGNTTTESYKGDAAEEKMKEVNAADKKTSSGTKKETEIKYEKVTKQIGTKEPAVKEQVKKDTTVVLKKTVRTL